MNTVNPAVRFTQLIGKPRRIIAKITLVNLNGTSIAKLRNGTKILVRGDTVAVNDNAFIVDGTIQSKAPNLPSYSVSV